MPLLRIAHFSPFLFLILYFMFPQVDSYLRLSVFKREEDAQVLD